MIYAELHALGCDQIFRLAGGSGHNLFVLGRVGSQQAEPPDVMQ